MDRIVLGNVPTFVSDSVTFNSTLKLHVVTPKEKNLTAWNSYWLMKGFAKRPNVIAAVMKGEELFKVMNASTPEATNVGVYQYWFV